ncbi:MAG: hypothetical protein BGN92_04870 [Sphingobacteriales bacterium 41-5]|nr:MAG: hypothetical protein BGN92_04870 [Sphingobacteriales bacterium 41-5]
MKQFNTILLALFLLPSMVFAQQKTDLRTVTTKVADLLMQVPPQNTASLNETYRELALLGEPGIKNITSKLVSPGKGNDAVMRYAISGISKYVGKSNDEKLRRSTSEAIANALATAKDDEVRDFLLQELQYVAGDEVVPTVRKYLQNLRLADPATRVLSRVNSGNANNALMYALSTAKGNQQLTLIKALGDHRYGRAAKRLLQLWPKATDTNLKKTLLRSLANIADASATTVLENAAQKANYKFDAADATGSYLVFMQRQLEKGNKSFVENAARKLLGNNTVSGQVKSAALSMLSKSASNASPEIFAALRSDDTKFRGTAIDLLRRGYTPAASTEVQAILKNTKDPLVQIQLINLLADKEDKSALPILTSLLNSDDLNVRLTAIDAVAKAGKEDAIVPLIRVIENNGNTEPGKSSSSPASKELEKAKSALLTIAGNNVIDHVAKALPNAFPQSKVALLDILAKRRAAQYNHLVFPETESSDPSVRLAAAKALADVATKDDAERIAKLLNKSTDAALTRAYQNAITNTVLLEPSKAAQITATQKLMQNSGNNQHLYYSVLSDVGGKEALDIVLSEYRNGDAKQKEAALKALSAWKDDAALDAVYTIAKTSSGETKNTVLNSFIVGINKSKNTTDQKVLMFRNAMALASTLDQKKNILSGISENSTLQSLLFVSKYFDDAPLQQNAVQAVINIVLDHKELYGKNVEAIANKAIELNKDTESDYLKQALIRHLAALPKEQGFVPMFNGKNLSGWKGLVENPVKRAKMTAAELASKQKEADAQMRKDWKVENGVLVFEGKGYNNLVSDKMYEDFEMVVDWRMEPKGDGGVYLRGSPQVQTWDTSRVKDGAQVGSGGLYNNKVNRSTPLMVADNPIGEWNTFLIRMVGDKVTVYLNGKLVTNNVVLENYWDRNIPIFDKEAIELQAHGTRLEFRDVYVKELPRAKPYELSAQEKAEGFVPMFNGVNLDGWVGNKTNYYAENGMIISDPSQQAAKGPSRNIYTEKEYSDFIMRFEFQLTPGANNGLGIRTPIEGDAAYVGMELQILDNEAEIYKDLKPYQYHGSVYGIIPSLRGYLKPVGEWNKQEVKAIGNRITITLNDKVILDGDIAQASKNNTETADHKAHPGLLNKSGHIGFLGHGSYLKFKNLRIKEVR